MEPRGRFPVRSSAMAPSVEPKTSMMRTPKRPAAASTTWGDPSLPKATRQGVVGVVRPRRGGQQVRQKLAGVVEPGGSVVPHVGKEPRRAEATGQGERGTGHQRRSEAGHQRVGVEEGHGCIADVVPSELEHHGHPVARGQQSALCAAHRLGRGRRSGSEEQHPERVDVGIGAGRLAPALTFRLPVAPGSLQCLLEGLTPGGRLVPVGETVRDEDPARECHSLGARSQLLLVARLGDDELDVGVRDVPAEMRAAPGVVQPRHGGTGQARTAEGEDVVGRVVQQEADVGRSAGVEPGAVQRGKALRLGQELPVCPLALGEAQGRTVGISGIRAVATQERRCVRSGKRHLGQRWSEPSQRRARCHACASSGLGVLPHRPVPPRVATDHHAGPLTSRSPHGRAGGELAIPAGAEV